MGFNSTYTLIYKESGLNTQVLAKTFVEYAKTRNIKLIDLKYLSREKQEANKTIFGIALTPIECNSLEGSNISKNWILIYFTSFSKAFLGWEEYLSKKLQTYIEIHNIHDSVNEYNVVIKGNKEQDKPSAKGIEWYVAKNYYDLKSFPRLNSKD